MLVRFRMANHRSIRDEQELSLVAEDDTPKVRASGLTQRGRPVRLLPTIGIFGANASGKSNALGALRAMRDAVLNSVAAWNQLPGVPREPFALCPKDQQTDSLYEVDVVLGPDKIRHTYGYRLSDDRIEGEWLHIYPEGRKQVWFERTDENQFHFPNGKLADGAKLAGATRPNALFLTVGSAFNSKPLGRVHDWFRDNLAFADSSSDVTTGRTWQDLTKPEHNPNRVGRITALLRAADLGITGVQVKRGTPTDGEVNLVHHRNDGEPVPLDFRTQESLGTHAWFDFLSPLLDSLERGSLLVVDELDSSLHPALAAEVIRLYHDHSSNRHGAQLLFTTHDATLLGKSGTDSPLGRDQVWITSKRKSGATDLYPLTDASPRKDENLERGYLSGRYGGTPRTFTGELAREMSDLLDAG
jgi:hypothetical protein